MTISEYLVENTEKLQMAEVDSPRLDCLILLEDVLQKDRAWIITHPEYRLQKHHVEALGKLIKRRLKREPLAYIRSTAWFYGRMFKVTPDTLIPRPESEDFIEILKQIDEAPSPSLPLTILDIGTGSGCLAITAKLILSNAEVVATDSSSKALKLAEQNAQIHKADIQFITSDLLTSVVDTVLEQKHSKKIITLIANLPYVPDGLITSGELLFEPREALFSGKDGLDHYRKLWKQILQLKFKPQHILIESLVNQHEEISKLAKEAGYELKQTKNLVQFFSRKTN